METANVCAFSLNLLRNKMFQGLPQNLAESEPMQESRHEDSEELRAKTTRCVKECKTMKLRAGLWIVCHFKNRFLKSAWKRLLNTRLQLDSTPPCPQQSENTTVISGWSIWVHPTAASSWKRNSSAKVLSSDNIIASCKRFKIIDIMYYSC